MTAATDATAMTSDDVRLSTPLTTPSTTSGVEDMQVMSTPRLSLAEIMKTEVVEALEDITSDVYDECGSLEFFLEYLAEERIMHMPTKNSLWDQVLRQAAEIGTQVDRVGAACGDRACASVTLTNVQLLLEVGHHQARALQPLIEIVWHTSMLLTKAWKLSTTHDRAARDSLVHAKLSTLFERVARLITTTTISVRQKINALTPAGSQTIDIGRSFGKLIDSVGVAHRDLSDRIWALAESTHKPFKRSIQDVRSALSSHHASSDHVGSLRYHLFAHVQRHAALAPGSCEWFQSPLLDFLRAPEDVLQVVGKSGTGKSTLARWTEHRLQRQLGRRSYDTLYVGEHDSGSDLSVARSLLAQLLESSAGDIELYHDLAQAVQARDESDDDCERDFSERLWSILGQYLAHVQTHTVLLIDGCRASTFERLHRAVHPHSLVKFIAFGAHHSSKHLDYRITADVNRRDITTYLREGLQRRIAPGEDVHVDETFLENIVNRAAGCFLWAYLYLQRVSMRDELDDCGLDVEGLLQDLTKEASEQTKLALRFILVAQRSLSMEETDALVGGAFRSRKDLVGSPLIDEHHGHLYFRHPLVRSYLREQLINFDKAEASVHATLVRTLLLSAKAALNDDCEPSMDMTSEHRVESVLLDYTARYWTHHYVSAGLEADNLKDCFPASAHFAQLEWAVWHTHRHIGKHSLSMAVREACLGKTTIHRGLVQSYIILATLHRHKGDHTRSAEYFFKACSGAQFCVGELSTIAVTCSTIFLVLTETMEFHSRTEICTMREQMLRFTIRYCKRRHGEQSDIVVRWYEVLIKLLVDIKEEHHHIILLYKELYEILICKHGGDQSHPKLKHVCREMNELKMVIHGEDEQDVEQYQDWVFETVEEEEHSHLEWSYERLLILIKLARKHAHHHHDDHWHRARRLYLLILRRAGELCRHNWSLTLCLFKMDICIEFAELLHNHGHCHEAHHILVTLWAEWEHGEECGHRDILIRLKRLAVVLRGFGFLKVTLDIFTKIFGWFKNLPKPCGGADGGQGGESANDDEAFQVTVLITEVIEEIEETYKETTVVVRTTRTETVIREVFETHYERCRRTGKTDDHFHKAVEVLIRFLLDGKNLVECEVVIRRTLKLTWRLFFKGTEKGGEGACDESDGECDDDDDGTSYDGDVFCGHNGDRDVHILRCLHLVRHLAFCHHHLGHFDRAERYYLRILRICLHSFSVEHEHVTHAWRALIAFYEEHHRYDKVVDVYLDVLVRYRKHCGTSHELTISILYALGRLCKKMGRHDYIEYYLDIVSVLEIQHCLEAAWVVCEFYHEHHKWGKLKGLCGSVWHFFRHGGEHCAWFTEEGVLCLYEWSICAHRKRSRGGHKHVDHPDHGEGRDHGEHGEVDLEMLYQITVEYRDLIRIRFGGASAIFIKILMALAKICEGTEDHYHEAITIYEEVITKTVTETTEVITEETIRTIKKRLAHVYVQVITRGRIGGTGTGPKGQPHHHHDPADGERALEICMEVYLHLKTEFGCWHERTLLQLEQVILILSVLGGDDRHHHMVTLLRGVVLEIVVTCHESMHLYKAATILATLYVKVSLHAHLEGFLSKLHHLIILPGMACEHDFDWAPSGQNDLSVLVFLVTCKQILHVGHCHEMSFSEVMAAVLLEMHLYSEVRALMHSETKVFAEVFVQTTARLHFFWYSTNRHALCSSMLSQLVVGFRGYFSCLDKVDDEGIVLFLEALCQYPRFFGERACKDFAHAVCVAANSKVSALLSVQRFESAHQVAKCALLLARRQHHYFTRNNVALGYKLAEYMAGIDVNSCEHVDADLYASMLKTSREIIAEVLFACKKADIDFVSLRFEDVSGLLRLLGTQGNFLELETMLLHLWQSREVQKTWQPSTVLSIGLALVHAHVAAEHLPQAITLCETISYNLRRSGDWLDDQAVQASTLLAQLLTLAGQHGKAMAVHEEVLREVDEEGSPEVYDKYAQRQVDTFRRSMERNGGYGKPSSALDLLFRNFAQRGFVCQGDVAVDDASDVYAAPMHWYLIEGPPAVTGAAAATTTTRHHLHVGSSAAARRVKAAARRSYGCGQVSLAGKMDTAAVAV